MTMTFRQKNRAVLERILLIKRNIEGIYFIFLETVFFLVPMTHETL